MYMYVYIYIYISSVGERVPTGFDTFHSKECSSDQAGKVAENNR